MAQIKQLNCFEILQALSLIPAKGFTATTVIDTGGLPPVDLALTKAPITSIPAASIDAVGKATGLIPANKSDRWQNLLLLFLSVAAIALICYILYRRRKDRKEEEFRSSEYARLPKINYPWPDAATQGPVLETEPEPVAEPIPEPEPVSYSPSLVEEFFKDPVPTFEG